MRVVREVAMRAERDSAPWRVRDVMRCLRSVVGDVLAFSFALSRWRGCGEWV